MLFSFAFSDPMSVRRIGAAALLVATTGSSLLAEAQSPDKVWRCGNEYTNKPGDAVARGCRPVEGGNLTIIQGLPAPAAATKANVVKSPANPTTGARTDAERVSSTDQRTRDSDAKLILEAELRKAETRLADLQAEYNNGNPEKRGDEFRNHQRYQERVAALQAELARTESDVTGLRRELARVAQPGTGSNGR